jgi:hypothetical protein
VYYRRGLGSFPAACMCGGPNTRAPRKCPATSDNRISSRVFIGDPLKASPSLNSKSGGACGRAAGGCWRADRPTAAVRGFRDLSFERRRLYEHVQRIAGHDLKTKLLKCLI